MNTEQQANLTKDGKFYNTEKATLLMVSEYFCSYGHKRRAWYKSQSGIYFQTFQHVKVPYNRKAFEDLTINRVIEKEEIVGECTFEKIQQLFEIAEQGNKIVIDSGVNSYCILRSQSSPQSKLAIVNKPHEFTQVQEV